LAVDWNAPPECPAQAELVSRVSRLLGGAVKSNLTAATDVTRAGGVYHARLRVTSAAGFGERTLENTRCEILTDSVALIIALSAAPASGQQSESTTSESGEGLDLSISAHATGVFGPLPQMARGVGGALAVEGFAALRFELSGTYYARQSTTFPQTTLGGRFDLMRFGARGCRLWSFNVFTLGPCIGAEIYYIQGSGFGGMSKSDGESLVWGPAVGVFGRLRLLKVFALYLAADGVAPVSRRRFVFSDVIGPLHRPSAVAFQVFIAPEVRF
jgi:hypothetical protein